MTVLSGSIDEFRAIVSGGKVAWAWSKRRSVDDYPVVAAMLQGEP
ncbi:hypothetical protein ACKUUI_00115 [Mycobacterium seoulense]